MPSLLLDSIMAGSCIVIRFLSYVFFRWVPGHPFPPIIFTISCIYFASLWAQRSSTEEATLKWKKSNRTTGQSESRSGAWDATRTLVFGLPSLRLSHLSVTSILLNVALLLGVVDVVWRGPLLYPSQDLSFVRIGYVSDTSARLLVREPDASHLPLSLSYRGSSPGKRKNPWIVADPVETVSNATDYTAVLELSALIPSKNYEYALSNGIHGHFTTAPPLGTVPSHSSKYTFLSSSCIKPNFPYNPLHHPLGVPGLKKLANLLPELKPQFMMFLGDFIYVDVPHRHGYNVETYRSEYRRVYNSPDWAAVGQTLSWLHVIDDHEIANDWDKGLADPYPAAIDPWNIYHSSVNPPTPNTSAPNATYFTFRQGPASFFMLDTRRFRTDERAQDAIGPDKSMLGADQLNALLTYLAESEPTGVHWKFITSSVPFTRNWRVNGRDTWAGYPHERKVVLDAMWKANAECRTTSSECVKVAVLSGDRHEFAATAFPPDDAPATRSDERDRFPPGTVYEFSTSPLNMFYLPIRSYREDPPEKLVGFGDGFGRDVMIKYIPDGNSKFGAIDLEASGLLRFRLFVDGRQKWEYVVSGD